MSKVQYYQNKVLELQNVLICKSDLTDESIDFNVIVEKMQSYIKVKGVFRYDTASD